MTVNTLPDSPVAVRVGEELDLNILNEYLRQNAPEVGEVLDVQQFPGGFSNLTYNLRTAQREYVLRRPPFGASIKGGHDMGREFRVLSLLNDHYDKVPAPMVYCESTEVMSAPFYIMERIAGVVLRANTAPKMNLAPALLRQTSEALIDNLVDIHAVDIQQTGLMQLGKPEGYVQRQVDGWTKRYYVAETDTIEAMNTVADWLNRNQPTEQSPAFLHNDYKYDNVLLDPNDLTQIRGVLDWEMATVGDPLMDLGAALAYWTNTDDGEALRSFNLTWLPGNLTRQEVVERYAEQSGRDVSNILFYYVFGLFKNAVIAQQIYARWKNGHTQDVRFGGLLPFIVSLAAKAVSSIESERI